MTRKRSRFFAAAAALLLSSCTLTNTADPQVGAAALTQVAATIAAGLTGTAEALPEEATAVVVPAGGSDAPVVTETSVPTSTPEAPLITVTIDTNCREGPGFKYLYKGALHVGEFAPVVGKPAEGDYVVIIPPTRPNERCWVWLEYATVIGSMDDVPVVNVPIVPRLSAIGGLVWYDACNPAAPGNPSPGCVEINGTETGDGVYNAGDWVKENLSVLLGEGNCPATGLRTDVTDADGRYFFGNLEAGTYCVSIQQPGPAAAADEWTFPYHSDGSIRAQITVEAGQHNTEVNFGYFCSLC
jgi:hypothetical protein